MIDNRNMILAVVLSIAILFGFEYFKKPTPVPQAVSEQKQTVNTPNASSVPTARTSDLALPQAPGSEPATTLLKAMGQNRSDILARNNRVKIRTPRLHGSIALTGALIDDLTLATYRETLNPESDEIILLSPKGVEGAYYGQFGWAATAGIKVPDQQSKWQANVKELTPETPLNLTWDNGQGLVFKRLIAVDENYMFTITQSVINSTGKPVTLSPYGLISRRGTPKTTNFYILHEGLLGVFDGTLKEVNYDDLQDDGKIEQSSLGGWIGITDKYWLTALVPDQKSKTSSRFFYRNQDGVDKYQTDFIGGEMVIQPGVSKGVTSRLFTGAKEVALLDGYAEKYGIENFDLAIDFGWFYFLTKPFFYALLWLNGIVLNLGVSILLLTVGLKAILFPLANKSYVSMSKMKKLQPEMVKLRERFGDDKMKLNQEMMALYKREKANPASGCLPIIIQIPIFFSLYKVLFVTIEMRQAPFFGWIQDLSMPDPTTVFNLFGLFPFSPPELLPLIGVWPLIMGITMFLQQKLNPQPTDPVQAKIFLFLPLIFTVMLASFPAGLVIYWAWNNLLSMAQQWVIMRRMGIKGKDALK